MAHQINTRDAQQGIVMAWHGITDVQEEIHFDTSPLNWELERRPLFVSSPNGELVKFHQDAIVASDDQLPVGDAVSGSYGVIQNRELWDTLISGLDDSAVKFRVASIGSVCDRTKVFISIELNEGSKFMVGDREFQFNLNAMSSHDGSGKAMFMDSSICIVCANTYQFSVNEFVQNKNKALRFAVKHSKNGAAKLINVAEGIENLISNRAMFCAELDKLGQHGINESDAGRFILGAIASPKAEEAGASTRLINTQEALLGLWRNGAGNKGENRLDLFQAFTDHYTHSHSGRGAQAQFVSSEFGSGQRMKELVFGMLSNENAFAQALKRGEQIALLS